MGASQVVKMFIFVLKAMGHPLPPSQQKYYVLARVHEPFPDMGTPDLRPFSSLHDLQPTAA